jgi:hypothetical protein
MKVVKTLLDFILFPVNDKIEFYRYIALQLANTILFPTLDIPISTINAIIDDFEAAVLAASDGSQSAKAVMRDKEKIADNLFRKLALFVDKVADGDETIIIKSGFHASKQPTPFQKASIALNHGAHSGSINVVMRAVLGAVAYRVKYRLKTLLGPVGEWIEVDITTVAHCLIEDLIPGSKYEVIFASISSPGTSDYSEPVTIIVI